MKIGNISWVSTILLCIFLDTAIITIMFFLFFTSLFSHRSRGSATYEFDQGNGRVHERELRRECEKGQEPRLSQPIHKKQNEHKGLREMTSPTDPYRKLQKFFVLWQGHRVEQQANLVQLQGRQWGFESRGVHAKLCFQCSLAKRWQHRRFLLDPRWDAEPTHKHQTREKGFVQGGMEAHAQTASWSVESSCTTLIFGEGSCCCQRGFRVASLTLATWGRLARLTAAAEPWPPPPNTRKFNPGPELRKNVIGRWVKHEKKTKQRKIQSIKRACQQQRELFFPCSNLSFSISSCPFIVEKDQKSTEKQEEGEKLWNKIEILNSFITTDLNFLVVNLTTSIINTDLLATTCEQTLRWSQRDCPLVFVVSLSSFLSPPSSLSTSPLLLIFISLPSASIVPLSFRSSQYLLFHSCFSFSSPFLGKRNAPCKCTHQSGGECICGASENYLRGGNSAVLSASFCFPRQRSFPPCFAFRGISLIIDATSATSLPRHYCFLHRKMKITLNYWWDYKVPKKAKNQGSKTKWSYEKSSGIRVNIFWWSSSCGILWNSCITINLQHYVWIVFLEFF